MRAYLLTLLAVSLVSGAAAAEEPVKTGDRYRNRPLAIEAQVAPSGGPIGPIGIAADVALIAQLSLTGGVGWGFSSEQWAIAVRPRIPVTAVTALELTAGYSHGDYTHFIKFDFGGGGADYERFRGGSWINADLGVQARFGSGVTLRLFLGASKLVDCRDAEHVSDNGVLPISTDRWPTLPYGGVAVGYAFGVE